jgi:hypothetical protein
MSVLAGIAEHNILNSTMNRAYITNGGNLSESLSYPDNGDLFLKAAEEFFNYSVTSEKIKFINITKNILKWEQWVLLHHFDKNNSIKKHLVSCDRPKFLKSENKIYLCGTCKSLTDDDGNYVNPKREEWGKIKMEPACGSGRRSLSSMKRAGIDFDYSFYPLMISNENIKFKIDLDKVKKGDFKKIDYKEIIRKLDMDDSEKEILLKNIDNKK